MVLDYIEDLYEQDHNDMLSNIKKSFPIVNPTIYIYFLT